MHLSFCLVTFLFLCPSTIKSIVDSFNKCESESGGHAGWCKPVLPLLGRNVGAAFSESREQHGPALQTLQPPHPPTPTSQCSLSVHPDHHRPPLVSLFPVTLSFLVLCLLQPVPPLRPTHCVKRRAGSNMI